MADTFDAGEQAAKNNFYSRLTIAARTVLLARSIAALQFIRGNANAAIGEPGKGLSHMTDETSAGWGQQPAPIGHNSGEGWAAPVVEVAPVQTFEVKYKSQPETEDPEAFRLRRNAEIEAWLNQKPVAKSAVELERDYRAKVAATLFPNPKKGTQRYDIGGGYKVKLVYGLTYTLGDKEAVDAEDKKIAIEAQVSKLESDFIEAHGEAGEQLLKRLIKWKPELSGTEYEKLDAEVPLELAARDAISAILQIKPASPTLDFEEPKAER